CSGSSTFCTGAEFSGAEAADREADGLVGAGADLGRGSEAAIEQHLAAETRGGGDTVEFVFQRDRFGVERDALFAAVGAVGGLQSQFAHALQDVGAFLKSAFSGLRQRDTVVGVAGCNVETVDLA